MSKAIKVNISFPVAEPAVSVCERINRDIAGVTPSVVSFGDGGSSSPHVTIAMGDLPQDTLPSLVRATHALVGELQAGVKLSFSQPYREDETGRYVLCNVFLDQFVTAWRMRAWYELQGLFTTPARVSEDPHLTIAHVEERWEEVDSYLRSCMRLPDCTVSRVEVALSGSKGRKLELLELVEIG